MEVDDKQLLTENSVDKVKFYFKDSPLSNRVITTCLFINSEKQRIEARGVAICSLRESFSEKDGKNRAFGRAKKALIRKVNSERINAKGREDELVHRLYKIKTKEDDEDFILVKAKELASFDPNLDVTIIDGDNKFLRKYLVRIPANYPIALASRYYRFKSQYRPNPSGAVEVELLRG